MCSQEVNNDSPTLQRNRRLQLYIWACSTFLPRVKRGIYTRNSEANDNGRAECMRHLMRHSVLDTNDSSSSTSDFVSEYCRNTLK